MVEAHLRYQDAANGLDESEIFQLTKDKQDATWRIFILDPARRSFDYRLVFRAADNRDVDSGWKTTEDEQVTVRDPFPRKRELDVVANVDWDAGRPGLRRPALRGRGERHLRGGVDELQPRSPPQRFTVDVEDPELEAGVLPGDLPVQGRPHGRGAGVGDPRAAHHRPSGHAGAPGRRGQAARGFRVRHLRRATTESATRTSWPGSPSTTASSSKTAARRGFFEFDYVDEARDGYESAPPSSSTTAWSRAPT